MESVKASRLPLLLHCWVSVYRFTWHYKQSSVKRWRNKDLYKWSLLSVDSVRAEASGLAAGSPGGDAVGEDDAGETDGDHRNWGRDGGRGREERAAHFLSASEYLTAEVLFLCGVALSYQTHLDSEADHLIRFNVIMWILLQKVDYTFSILSCMCAFVFFRSLWLCQMHSDLACFLEPQLYCCISSAYWKNVSDQICWHSSYKMAHTILITCCQLEIK